MIVLMAGWLSYVAVWFQPQHNYTLCTSIIEYCLNLFWFVHVCKFVLEVVFIYFIKNLFLDA